MSVATRTFCCCIPTRLGAILIALIGLLGGGALAIAGALNASSVQGSKAPIAISVVIYALLAIVSIVGLMGAVGRRLILVKVYFFALVAHLAFSFIVGTYALSRIFKDGNSFISHCVAANPGVEHADKVCAEGLKVVKGVSVTLFIIVWIFEIWACVIVKGYHEQLNDEVTHEGVVKDTEAW